MKKFNFKFLVLILLVGSISGIQFLFLYSLKTEIVNKTDMKYQENNNSEILIMVQKNIVNIEETIAKFNLHLNDRMDELLIKTMDQSISIKALKKDIENKRIPEVKELKDFLIDNLEKVEKNTIAERLLVSKETVESDFLLQTLLDQGFSKYSDKNFAEAVKIYIKVLDIDSKNREAVCYFYASLYYQNPGDSTHYSDIKNSLTPLLETDVLSEEEESTVLTILKGISLEEGNR